MKKGYVLSAIFLASVLILSCRQDDENISEKEPTEKIFSAQETAKITDSIMMMSMSDSINIGIMPTDPPKSGTHWKLIDSLSIQNPAD